MLHRYDICLAIEDFIDAEVSHESVNASLQKLSQFENERVQVVIVVCAGVKINSFFDVSAPFSSLFSRYAI